MIVALLVVIVLTLLFGAAVVKGWLANLFGVGCGGMVILAALLWLGSFLGENGPAYLLYGITALVGLVVVVGYGWSLATTENPTPVVRKPPLLAPERKNENLPKPPAEQGTTAERDRVWAWFADDIALRFTPEARVKATQLYDANDAVGLDRFCRGQRNNPYR